MSEAATIDAERQTRADAHVAAALEQAGVAIAAAQRAAEAAQAAAELRAEVTVHVEPTPVAISVEPTPIVVSPADVTVNVPAAEPPVVNVLPAVSGHRRVAIERDAYGRIAAADIEEQA